VSPAEKGGFNPQPDPPGKGAKYVSPAEKGGFNPQPDPPGKGTVPGASHTSGS
jgi:hypothetical protein